MDWLDKFVHESNRIEGLNHASNAEVEAHRVFLESRAQIPDLEKLVQTCVPGHQLRDQAGLDVLIGMHIPPKGGPEVRGRLKEILHYAIESRENTPFETHCFYEKLHPFTDGNGRSGRALWLWMMVHQEEIGEAMAKEFGFLHSFYYQTLAAQRP